jgi:hypothetical protein
MALIALQVDVCSDRGFICENTGSRKGYRQWIFGLKTGHWYKKSPLEQFIARHDADALVHRWTSYAGTGKNVFGMSIVHGHGCPGAVYEIDHDIQKRWIARQSPEDVRKLYDLLVSDDQDAIGERVTGIWKEVLEYETCE